MKKTNDDIRIIQATNEHINSWIELVEIMKDNFPGLETKEKMNNYRLEVEEFIANNEAICAVYKNKVVGIILYSKEKNILGCLGVHPDYRRQHIASRMIEMMLDKMDKSIPVTLTTFRDGDEKGIVPRAFYKKLGFVEGELCKSNSGYPVQRFYLDRGENK